MDELVVRFDGSIVELWYAGRGDSDRFHVAQIERVELLRLDNNRGPTLHIVGQQRGGVALTRIKMRPEMLTALQQIVAEINAAIPR